jgi:hypothetical protein
MTSASLIIAAPGEVKTFKFSVTMPKREQACQ